MATPNVYVICDNNCKYEGMTKEQILAAIAQAIETGTVGDCDTGFITTIKTINGQPLRFFVGEQSEYEALTDKENLFAIITNDTTKESIIAAVETLQEIMDGDRAVPLATNATNLIRTENILAYTGTRIENIQIERGKTYIFNVYFNWENDTAGENHSFILSIPNADQTPTGYTSRYYSSCSIQKRVVSAETKIYFYRIEIDISYGNAATLYFHEYKGADISGGQYVGNAKIIYHEIDSISA